jgi:hypothetical protein
MKRVVFVGLAVALLGCDAMNAGEVRPASVLWMEWPASVQAGRPFQIRVVIPPLCSHNGNLDVRQSQAGDVVAFEVRWLDIRPSEWGCEPAGPIYGFSTIDAAGISGSPRSLEIRATRGGLALDSLRRFGTIALVAGDTPDRILAAGYARFLDESLACPRIRPGGTPTGLPPSPAAYALSGSRPDSATAGLFWVEGYFEHVTGACGPSDTLAFRVVTYSAP